MKIAVSKDLFVPIKKYIAQWGSCSKCPLHKDRIQPVLLGGSFPCDILFITAYPLEEESVVGMFNNPYLDVIFQRLSKRCGVVSLAACGSSMPNDTDATTCFPRITQLVNLVKPKLIVCLGKGTHRLVTINKTFHQISTVYVESTQWLQHQTDLEKRVVDLVSSIEATYERVNGTVA